MGNVKRFEDLIAWAKARLLTRQIYEITRINGFSRDFGLSSQIQRSAVSIMSNIAEGFERGSAREFHRALTIAKGSCAELRAQLYIAFDVGYISHSKLVEVMTLAAEVSRILGGLRNAVAKHGH